MGRAADGFHLPGDGGLASGDGLVEGLQGNLLAVDCLDAVALLITIRVFVLLQACGLGDWFAYGVALGLGEIIISRDGEVLAHKADDHARGGEVALVLGRGADPVDEFAGDGELVA